MHGAMAKGMPISCEFEYLDVSPLEHKIALAEDKKNLK